MIAPVPIHCFSVTFNTISRDLLWKIMAKFGCPPRFIAMLRQFHDDMQAKNREENARAVHTDDEAIARTTKTAFYFQTSWKCLEAN